MGKKDKIVVKQMWKDTLIHMTMKLNAISDSVTGFQQSGNRTPNGT